jgi:alkylation response protein AidB-like acyl-CoA dehydrogenase
MDLTPNDIQRQALDAVDRILQRNGDTSHNKKLVEQIQYDEALHAELAGAGFFDLALTEGAGPLDAALVVERLAENAAVLAASATALVFPMVTGETAAGPVALSNGQGSPFRMGQFATSVLILDGDVAKRLDVGPGDVEPVNNDRTGWPLARLSAAALQRAPALGPGKGDELRNWWRTAIALEAAGAMKGALRQTVGYVKDRVQFGRPIGSFQAIQHRLAQLTVGAEGAYWLGLEAAYRGAPAEAAAAAAAYVTSNAPLLLRETQQMHGAIGFTREYPLHLWTMRLPALQRELGGLTRHARDVAKGLAAGLEAGSARVAAQL